MSMPLSGREVAITPATSPSLISRMRAPALRTAAISSWWRGRSRIRTTSSLDRQALGLGQAGEIGGRRVGELDHARRQAAADGDLVHVGVGRVEEAAVRRHGDAGDRVGRALGGDRGALERVEGDVDLGAAARCRPSRRCRASAPRRARPRRSPRCRRCRARSAPGASRRPLPGRPPSRRRGRSAGRWRGPRPRSPGRVSSARLRSSLR